jgi:DNA-binding GntR family transcriptional regulator
VSGRGEHRAFRLAFERTHCLHILRLHYFRVLGPDVLAEHHGIVDAVTSGDPDAADEAMRRHIETA